jgi:DNA-binding HxlR family transcriptional regulator
MLGRTYDSQICSIARALEVVGERWSLLILRDAVFAGVTRFGDFQHNLGIATNVLQARLDAFVEGGLMERRDVAGRGRLSEYAVTPMGRDLAPTLVALTEWGDRWAAPGEPPILYGHDGCDEVVHARAVCDAHGVLEPADVSVRLGPGMPATYVAARRPRREAVNG